MGQVIHPSATQTTVSECRQLRGSTRTLFQNHAKEVELQYLEKKKLVPETSISRSRHSIARFINNLSVLDT